MWGRRWAQEEEEEAEAGVDAEVEGREAGRRSSFHVTTACTSVTSPPPSLPLAEVEGVSEVEVEVEVEGVSEVEVEMEGKAWKRRVSRMRITASSTRTNILQHSRTNT